MASEPPTATEPRNPVAMRNWRDYVGRFHVEVELANNYDVGQVRNGRLPPEQVRRTRISGLVDTGATQLVLPPSVVGMLGLPDTGQTAMVKFADGRREPRAVVTDVRLEHKGRWGIFNAVVEPGRTDALIGAIVLEQLDFLPACTHGELLPRDPNTIIAEIE
jgi:predicted aspartyl protease